MMRENRKTEKKQVLIIDDEENMRHMLSALLAGQGYFPAAVADGEAGLEQLAKEEYDFVLCDIRMPKMDGIDFLKASTSRNQGATIIMMSAFGTVDTAIEAMKLGAYDFISKPFKTDEVVLVLKKAEERERLRRENRQLKKKIADLEQSLGLGTMIGRSKPMRKVFSLADKVAEHLTTILITGESGTGKELVARGIHEKSPRSHEPFFAVNCGGVPENLLESEFFGYVKGAFTGADKDTKGLFESADGSTLFLDEIGELPLSMQVKLLRVLQEHEVRRVGAAQSRKVDVRIVAATAKDLAHEVAEGRFREDLFYRLNVINIELPSLREHPSDIPLLCDFFIERFVERMDAIQITGVDPAAMKLLMAHSWPGNVRELENVLERAVVLADSDLLLPEDLPKTITDNIAGFNRGGSGSFDDLIPTLSIKDGRKIVESYLIQKALKETSGNKSKATKLLEISYPSLLSKIKEYLPGDRGEISKIN